jgi:predicted nuclease of predicted toxin-antitoxin system
VRILLDESLPRGLKDLLPGLDAVTVPERGWQSMKNGELLRLASQEFAVFVTADQNLEYQQHLPSVDIAIVVLVAASNRMEAYLPLGNKLRDAIQTARKGAITKVAA